MKKIIGLSLLAIGLLTIAGSTNLFSSVHASNRSSSTPPVALVKREMPKGKLTRTNFEDSIRSLYNAIGLSRVGMNYDVFRFGMIGYYSLEQQGKLSDRKLVSFIDFTKASTEKRFYTVDLQNKKLTFHSLVSHGRNTGQNMATSFSNIPHSNQSSIGFYLTGETYVGSKGYSMRLDGIDGAFNNRMRDRAVVMHDAAYVSEHWIKKYGRLGRSQGCPALPREISRKVIDTIKNKTLIFAYFNDQKYLASSEHLQIDKLFDHFDAIPMVTAEL